MRRGDHGPSRCPACGGPLSEPYPVNPSEPALRSHPFALRRCVRCGSAVTVGAAPADAHESGAYRPGAPRLHEAARPALGAFDRRRLALLAPHAPPPARLLDVGAGRGRFVAAAVAAGYDARGIEPSARGVLAARELGAPVERAGIGDATVEPGAYDAITLWHVLEHLDDPGAALAVVAQWLAPAGVVLLGVPNYGSLQARLGGRRWYHLDVPRHRVHFTVAGLEALLAATDLQPVSVTHVLAEHNPFGMWQSLVSLATVNPSYAYNALKRNASARSPDLAVTALALPLAPVAALAELLAGLGRRGGTIAVIARRAPGARFGSTGAQV